MDEEGLEDLEEDTPEGFEALPKETQQEIKRLRKENQAKTKQIKGLEGEVGNLRLETLTAKYGEKLVGLIPPEITSHERQIEFVEALKAVVPSPETETSATETPENPSKETEVPAGLQAMTGTPTAASAAPNADADLSAAELGKIAAEDPARFARAVAAKYPEG